MHPTISRCFKIRIFCSSSSDVDPDSGFKSRRLFRSPLPESITNTSLPPSRFRRRRSPMEAADLVPFLDADRVPAPRFLTSSGMRMRSYRGLLLFRRWGKVQESDRETVKTLVAVHRRPLTTIGPNPILSSAFSVAAIRARLMLRPKGFLAAANRPRYAAAGHQMVLLQKHGIFFPFLLFDQMRAA